MSVNSEEQCRLCLSERELISMFWHKSQRKRDFLREIIYETININIEKCDECSKFVCLRCCCEITDFYYFRLSCTLNESKFKPLAFDKTNDIIDTKLDYLLKELVPWLKYKLKRIKQFSDEVSTIITNSIDKNVQTELETLTKATQKSFNDGTRIKKHKEVQCCFKIHLNASKYTQTDKSEEEIPKKGKKRKLHENITSGNEINPKTTNLRQVEKETQCDLMIFPPEEVLNNKKLYFNSKYSETEVIKEEIVSPRTCLTIYTEIIRDQQETSQTPVFTDLLTVTGKCDTIKTCKYCEKAIFSNKEGVLHRKVHKQCNLCKKKFRSFKAAMLHREVCNIRQLHMAAPYVLLEKIDGNAELRRQFPKAFFGLSDV